MCVGFVDDTEEVATAVSCPLCPLLDGRPNMWDSSCFARLQEADTGSLTRSIFHIHKVFNRVFSLTS